MGRLPWSCSSPDAEFMSGSTILPNTSVWEANCLQTGVFTNQGITVVGYFLKLRGLFWLNGSGGASSGSHIWWWPSCWQDAEVVQSIRWQGQGAYLYMCASPGLPPFKATRIRHGDSSLMILSNPCPFPKIPPLNIIVRLSFNSLTTSEWGLNFSIWTLRDTQAVFKL